MAKHSSATARKESSHSTQTTRTATIINALKRRAQAVLNDKSIDAQTRAIIRYGLETNDPWLADLVRRADAGENIGETFDASQTLDVSQTFDLSQTPEERAPATAGPTPKDDHSSKEKIEALAEIISRGGNASAAALFVLMATLQNSAQPKVLANTAKHFAFTRCGELNLYGIVDAQIAVLEGELLSGQ